MNSRPTLPAFAGYGIELEYMIVDRQSLAVMPVADSLLHAAAGAQASNVERGRFGWSNEMVLHLIEVKNVCPDLDLVALAYGFQSETHLINQLLEPLGAQLMPTGMHPWMDPAFETRLWPHEHAAIYQAYDRIFNCKQHGQANLQSMHVNLPFASDAEFARLQSAVRLVLPILPALAASSPLADGRASDHLDTRMDVYGKTVERIPAVAGQIIPDTCLTRLEYEEQILKPLYQAITPLDPHGELQHEWLNARGAIPRFDRSAIEIRVIDMQECPLADMAVAAATTAVIRALYDGVWSPSTQQHAVETGALANMFRACTRDAELAVIDDPDYLRMLGFPASSCLAGELWQHLIATCLPVTEGVLLEPLRVILRHGPLARRIMRALGTDHSRAHMHSVYQSLCTCLAAGHPFIEE